MTNSIKLYDYVKLDSKKTTVVLQENSDTQASWWLNHPCHLKNMHVKLDISAGKGET